MASIRGDERQLLKYLVRVLEPSLDSRRLAIQEAARRCGEWKFKPTWAGISRQTMARSIRRPGSNRAWEYAHAYDVLSESSHMSSGSLVALDATFSEPGAYPQTQGRDPAKLAASLTAIWLLQLADLVAEVLAPARRAQLPIMWATAQQRLVQAGIIRPRS